MSRKREHGRIISIESMTRGDALAEDAAAGATSITVEDAGDFDEDGGWLTIGGQVVEFSECDDDTGVILLVDPLTAAAEQGDPVQVWSDLYEEVIEFQQALVELDGEYDNPDPVVAEVAEGVGELPEGDRGRAGESCTLKRVADDEWEVAAVGGRSRRSQRTRWEQDDFYTLTAADITAGLATMPLSHRPNDEALTCILAGVPQQPTEWSIDYEARTLTIPLDGWEQPDDVLWVHYAYRKGIATATGLALVGSTFIHYPAASSTSSIDLPAGTQAGDIIVLAAISNATVSMSDARMTQRLDAGGDFDGKLWTGVADESGNPVGLSMTVIDIAHYASAALAVFRGASISQIVAETGSAGASIESVGTRFAVAAAFAGYAAVDDRLFTPEGWSTAADLGPNGPGKTQARIAYWVGDSAGSPASTWVQMGEEYRFGAMVVGLS